MMDDSNLTFKQVFVQQKGMILLVTFLFTCFCTALIYQYKPIYRAKVMLSTLTEVDSSFHNVSLIDYLELSERTNFNLAELYNLFTRSLISPVVKDYFFKQVYLPAQFDKKESKSFSKIFDVQLHVENRQKKYLVSARANSSKEALDKLTQYLDYVNQKASERLFSFMTMRKHIFFNALFLPLSPAKAQLYQNDNDSLDFRVFRLLSKIYDENYFLFNSPLIHAPKINFAKKSLINISSTELGMRFTIALAVGIFGGLILGFFIGVLRIVLQETSKKALHVKLST